MIRAYRLKCLAVFALHQCDGTIANVKRTASSRATARMRPGQLFRADWLAKLGALLFLAASVCAAQTGDPNPVTPQQPASPVGTQSEQAPYEPITGHERFQWTLDQTIGLQHIASGIVVAAFGTARDAPPEYRGTWAGFGKRFGYREASTTLSNAMEAGIGAIWGEDPRYFRNAELPFGHRVGNVIKQTFLARRRDGNFHLALARYTAITGSNFLTNTWRPNSEADTQHALSRTGFGFLGRFGSNAWDEFWPDAKQHILHRNH
jgi:hypothetical protein